MKNWKYNNIITFCQEIVTKRSIMKAFQFIKYKLIKLLFDSPLTSNFNKQFSMHIVFTVSKPKFHKGSN